MQAETSRLKCLKHEFNNPGREDREEEVLTAMRFLSMLETTASPRAHSYQLKHDAEHWGRDQGFAPYVANASLITAAVRLGLLVRDIKDGPNAFINVNAKQAARIGFVSEHESRFRTWQKDQGHE